MGPYGTIRDHANMGPLEFQGPYGPLRNSSPCGGLARCAHKSSRFAPISVNMNTAFHKTFRHPPDIFLIFSRHLLDTFQTPSRDPLDTL